MIGVDATVDGALFVCVGYRRVVCGDGVTLFVFETDRVILSRLSDGVDVVTGEHLPYGRGATHEGDCEGTAQRQRQKGESLQGEVIGTFTCINNGIVPAVLYGRVHDIE